VTLPLRLRLAVTSMIVSALLLGAVSVVSYSVLARWLDDDAGTRLRELTEGLHGYLNVTGGEPSIDFNPNDSDQVEFVQEATRYYQLYDVVNGRLVFQSAGLAPLGLHLTPAEVQAYRAQPRPFDIGTDYGRLRISNGEIRDEAGRTYLVQVGVSLRTIDAALSRYRDLLLWLALPSLLATAVGSWWLSGIALTPLSRLAGVAREIDVSTLQRRLPTRGAKDELDDVARAFNETLERLEQSVGEMRQFSAALAHELRTPLAALRGEIELALRVATTDDQRRVLASQIEEVDKLTRLIDQVLTLARAEAGQIPLLFVPVNVSDLAASLVEQLEPVAQARGIELRCERAGPVIVDADAGWLQRLLLNLLDNAIKFTPEGGRVVLGVSADGSHARLAIRDTGIGMSAEQADHAFERFYQADASRSAPSEGVGLGLSLVKWIVDRHHGTIEIDSRLGEGSTFTVTLPGPGRRSPPPSSPHDSAAPPRRATHFSERGARSAEHGARSDERGAPA
jgi:heavy metal sensor kinase